MRTKPTKTVKLATAGRSPRSCRQRRHEFVQEGRRCNAKFDADVQRPLAASATADGKECGLSRASRIFTFEKTRIGQRILRHRSTRRLLRAGKRASEFKDDERREA